MWDSLKPIERDNFDPLFASERGCMRTSMMLSLTGLWQFLNGGPDGSEATQLLRSDDRQAGPVFSHDGKELVYMQDKGGDELYDLYAVPVAGK